MTTNNPFDETEPATVIDSRHGRSTRLPAREKFGIGSILSGRYRIVDDRAHGGMGRVYFADDLDFGLHGKALRVAIKTVPDFEEWHASVVSKGQVPDPGHYADATARFRREALTWVRLGMHPNLIWAIQVLDVGAKPYLVMEFADGGDLTSVIGENGLPLSTAINFAIQFCDGMSYAARSASIVHRDIKPANVLLKKPDIIKISDFGLAKALGSLTVGGLGAGAADETIASAGFGGGTPGYAAPEQFYLGGLDVADTRSDIFSFGAMFFEMLTGRRLFADRAEAQAFALTRTAPRLSVLNETAIPATVARIVIRCVEHDPARRFGSFDEVRDALSSAWTGDAAVIAAPVDEAYERRRAVNRPGLQLLSETYTHLQLSRFADAVECATRAIAIEPDNAEHWINKSKAHWELGDVASARACALEATRLNPRDVHGWANLAWATLESGEAREALDLAVRAIGVDEGFADAWMCRAACERKLGQLPAAVISAKRAIELEPHNWKPYIHAAGIMRDAGALSEAFTALSRATQINPRFAPAWLDLAWLHARVRSWRDGRVAVDAALGAEPRNADAWAMFAWMLWETGSDAESIQRALDRAREIDPSNDAAATIGRAYAADSGRQRRASEHPQPASMSTLDHVRIVSGTPAKLSAIDQRVIGADSAFGAAVVLLDANTIKTLWRVHGTTTCQDCGLPISFDHDLSPAWGMSSARIRCGCGAEATLMSSPASNEDGYHLIVTPFIGRHGAAVGEIDVEIAGIVAI